MHAPVILVGNMPDSWVCVYHLPLYFPWKIIALNQGQELLPADHASLPGSTIPTETSSSFVLC